LDESDQRGLFNRQVNEKTEPARLDYDDFEQSLIFDKFYRGRNEQYRVQGAEMGPAIAKAVLEAHSGTIRVTN
jgi:signal transduction histidine kinase